MVFGLGFGGITHLKKRSYIEIGLIGIPPMASPSRKID
jgi:hypothetical protein